MALSDDYKQALIALRPRGKIWVVKEDSVTDRKLDIQAEAFAKAEERADDLFKEANKQRTVELLEEWENVYGLPHDGKYEDRIAILNSVSASATQDIKFYKKILELQGLQVVIEEHCPFMFGLSRFGENDECGDEFITFYWDIFVFSGTDEAIAAAKKVIARHNQSHTIVKFIDMRG